MEGVGAVAAAHEPLRREKGGKEEGKTDGRTGGGGKRRALFGKTERPFRRKRLMLKTNTHQRRLKEETGEQEGQEAAILAALESQ